MPFMIVGYPWPVPSAHVELTGTNRLAKRRQQNPHDQQPVTEADQERRILTAAKA